MKIEKSSEDWCYHIKTDDGEVVGQLRMNCNIINVSTNQTIKLSLCDSKSITVEFHRWIGRELRLIE
jgi:hypothetical protein